MIFATAPPFTDFLIGREIKNTLNIPLVLDYRDPWVDYPFKFYPTPVHKLLNIQLERRALRASSHVVTTNRKVKETPSETPVPGIPRCRYHLTGI